MRSLQRTNPQLLLTPTQLRSTVRELRYIPALALAVSQIISRDTESEGSQQVLDDIHQWRHRNDQSQVGHIDISDLHLEEATICTFTEERLRCLLKAKQSRLEERKRKKSRTAEVHVEENQYSDLDESDDEEDDVANPRAVHLHDESSNRNAWTDFTEIFRNPSSVSPDSPEASNTMNTPEKASHRSSPQNSVVDDDWW